MGKGAIMENMKPIIIIKQKRYCRTYQINGEGSDIFAFVWADDEEDADTEFFHQYQDTDEKEYVWTSPIFEINKND